MNRVDPLLRVGGPILGFILVWWVISSAVGTFQADMEAERKARLAAVEMAVDAEGAVEEEAASDESGQTEAPEVEPESETEAVPEAEDDAALDQDDEATSASESTEDVSGGSEADAASSDVSEDAADETDVNDMVDESAPEVETPESEAPAESESDGEGAVEEEMESGAAAPVDTELAFTAMIQSGCGGCHVIPGVAGAVGVVGPDLSNVGDPDAVPLEGYSVDEYIRESILMPNAYIAENCPNGPCLANVMLQTLADTLSAEELDAIVGYLSTLQEGG